MALLEAEAEGSRVMSEVMQALLVMVMTEVMVMLEIGELNPEMVEVVEE